MIRRQAARIPLLTGAALAGTHGRTSLPVAHEDILIREEGGLLRSDVGGFGLEGNCCYPPEPVG
jgi:hypothetical protein